MNRLRQAAAIVILVAGDVGAILLSYLLAYAVRNWLLAGVFDAAPNALPGGALGERAYLLLVYPFMFAYEGLYTKRLMGWEETRRLARGVIIATAAVMILLFLWRFWIVSRVAVVLSMVFGLVLAPVVRAVLKRFLVAIRLGVQPLVVLGGGNVAALFDRQLGQHRALGYEVVERIERGPAAESMEELLARAGRPDAALVVVSDAFSPDELKGLFSVAEQRFAEMLVIPNEGLLQGSASDIEQVGSVLVMKYRYNLLSPLNRYAKRLVEIALSVVLAGLLLPLLGLLAVLVRVSSPGPVFFRQPRIGRYRRLFSCIKFRTMYVDAEKRLPELLKGDAAARAEYERYARIARDPRVTPIGRFLRRTSLDELPQLWNVLRGDMALVGPRPYLPGEVERIGASLDTIVRVRPGMTGLWQVSGRAELPFRERNVLDEYYIRHWSLWMDISIVVRTLRAVVGGRGAY